MTKKLIAASALTLMLGAGTAFAQTYTTGSTGTVDPTTTDTSGTTVGVPNTGAGGNALENYAIMGTSLAFALAAAVALASRRRNLA